MKGVVNKDVTVEMLLDALEGQVRNFSSFVHGDSRIRCRIPTGFTGIAFSEDGV